MLNRRKIVWKFSVTAGCFSGFYDVIIAGLVAGYSSDEESSAEEENEEEESSEEEELTEEQLEVKMNEFERRQRALLRSKRI